MSIWFAAGAEHDEMRLGDTLVRWWEWHSDTAAGVHLDNTYAYTGTWSTKCPMNGAAFQARAVGRTLGSGSITAAYRYTCWVYIDGWPTTTVVTLSAIAGTSSAGMLASLVIRDDGKVQFRADFGGATQTSAWTAWTLSTGSWHAVTMWFDWPNAEAKCWVDDQTVLTVSDAGNENAGTFALSYVYHGENLAKGVNNEMSLWVDDCVFNDTNDSVNDWGAVATPLCRIVRRGPTGDPGSPDADWTKGGGGTASYTEWDEMNQPDDDTTYNYVSGASEQDQLSTMADHGLTADDTIVCVMQFDQDRSVTSSTTDYRHLADDGGTKYTDDPGSIGTNYVARRWTMNKRPSGPAWDKTSFDALKCGGRKNGADAVQIRVTVMALNLIYYYTAPGVGASYAYASLF